MHARAKGKSGSKHPETGSKDWVAYEPNEVKEFIVALAKEGKSPSMIGLVLRDQYGIPSVKAILGAKVGSVLAENKLQTELPEDLQNLVTNSQTLRKHLNENKRDLHNRRALHLIESKILRLTKYYRKSGRIPESWRYEPSEVQLNV